MRRDNRLAGRPLEADATLDRLGGELLRVVADIMAVVAVPHQDAAQESEVWLSLPNAAEHLGLHRDTLRKRAKEGLIPFEQDAPGCRIYFCRSDLDAWRHAGGAPARLAQVADLSAKRSKRGQ